VTITPNLTSLSFPFTSTASAEQAGGLLAFNNSKTVLVRFGVSMISADKACANAEEEIPSWDWDTVENASVAKWEDVLERVMVDTSKEDATVVELLYSSVSLSLLTFLTLMIFPLVVSCLTCTGELDR
jgi:putative alpha-1,2-mannosidase